MNYIWIIFTGIFAGLALYHFWQATHKIGHIQSKGNVKSINGNPVGVSEFVGDFNSHIDDLNRNSRTVNLLAGAGYTAAAFTALFSFWLAVQVPVVPQEMTQGEMNALYLEVATDDRNAAIASIGDPAFSSYVFDVLDKQCPFYVPDGASYRNCLWEVVDESESTYTRSSSTPQEIDEQCQSLAAHLDGLVAGEIVLSCRAFKLSKIE